MRYKIWFLLLWAAIGISQEMEVLLKTTSSLTPIYISRISTDPNQFDWRYFDELRSILEFDLKRGGFATVLDIREESEQTFQWPDTRREFNLTHWKQQKVPYVLTLCIQKNALQLTAFNTDQETSKRYPECLITGKLEEDRKQLHKLADQLHKDLFGEEGIASLRIIYSQRIKNTESTWLSDIWISDADGANSKQATFENAYCITPAFYPSTAGLNDPPFFFVSYKQGQSKIYRTSLKNGEPESVIELRGNQLLPAINLKGSQMAFIADAAGRPDLFVQTFDPNGRPLGKSRQLYSCPRATQASPTFSPNGKKIAFVSDKDGPPRIYLIDVTTSKDTKRIHPFLLTRKNRENTSPAWSPDGKKLAYSAKVDGVRQIWIYDFETEEEIPLTSGPGNKENPAWAPDSLHLVFNTDDEEEGQLFLINLNQREPTQITKGPGQKRFANWETRSQFSSRNRE
ncbi:MAG: Tol-Pal system protein TolB [Verrucomicrobiota bacterium]|nr:Tol-Pal system protein TolB [Verrucomicrobiota bacterium]